MIPYTCGLSHIDRYASLARCAYHKHKLSLFSSHRPCLTPTPLFIDLVLARSFPLHIVCLSHHLLDASLSLYPSSRALFASNTYMHVYRSISLHIPRSTSTISPHPSIDRSGSVMRGLQCNHSGSVRAQRHARVQIEPMPRTHTRTCTRYMRIIEDPQV